LWEATSRISFPKRTSDSERKKKGCQGGKPGSSRNNTGRDDLPLRTEKNNQRENEGETTKREEPQSKDNKRGMSEENVALFPSDNTTRIRILGENELMKGTRTAIILQSKCCQKITKVLPCQVFHRHITADRFCGPGACGTGPVYEKGGTFQWGEKEFHWADRTKEGPEDASPARRHLLGERE